jgi:hypothetical protein
MQQVQALGRAMPSGLNNEYAAALWYCKVSGALSRKPSEEAAIVATSDVLIDVLIVLNTHELG